MTGDLNELAAALAGFQAEVPVIPRKQSAQIETGKGRNFSYTYAGLGDIAPVVMPLLAKHGLSFTAMPIGPKGDRGPVLRGMLLHTSGQHVTGELPISGRTPQEMGSAITYARRYMIGCLTGVVTDEDEDGQLAQRGAERAARRRRETGTEPPPVAPPVPIRRRTPVGPAPGSPHGSETGPAPDDTPAPAETPEEQSEEQSEAMRRALFGAVGKALGPNADRAERLALCGAVVGREITSSTDLTRPEVSRVLDWLERQALGQVDWQWDAVRGVGHVFALNPEEG